MNCNSNTMPLINTSEPLSCNNGCIPKDINVVCRVIIIPTGQEILGVQGDIGSISRTFVLPKTTEEGYDLSNKTFAIILQNDEGEQWNENIPFENIEETENYIKIKWDLKAKDTQVAGDLKVSIKVSSEDFVWQTYVTSFVIQSSLIDPGEIPAPLNLQEKIVEPTKDTQIITYDKGYEGLRNVTVNGDENLISKNIKSGETIFGVNGDINVLDTSNATATAEDISKGKVAYANGEKIVGTLESNYNVRWIPQQSIGVRNISVIDFSNVELPEKVSTLSFASLTGLSQIIGLERIDTSNVTSMDNMFSGCTSLKTLNLTSFNTSKVQNMASMFHNCQALTELNLSGFDTANVTNMSNIFDSCESLTELNLSSFDIRKANDISYMFNGCKKLNKIIFGENFNTQNVKNMAMLFSNCSSLTELDLSTFNTKRVNSMAGLFSSCESLKELQINHFDMYFVNNLSSMFNGCRSLKTLGVDNLKIDEVSRASNMFSGCDSLSDESLNSILKMLSTVEALSPAYRDLNEIGLTQLQAEKCTTLSNWNLAEAAGWTTGY